MNKHKISGCLIMYTSVDLRSNPTNYNNLALIFQVILVGKQLATANTLFI